MNDFKSSESLLSVTLRKNNLSTQESAYIGRVTRNTVTLENLIADITEKNSGVSPYMIQHVANLLGDSMLQACKTGKAVDVLGLGTLYVTVDGGVIGENPSESNIPGFKLNFTPSQKAQSVLDTLKVDKVVFSQTQPVINKIINTFDKTENLHLTRGKVVKIIGSKLKIAGADSGIWFAPQETDGTVTKDEATWITVEAEKISSNLPKSLEFYIPENLSENTTYVLILRTRYCNGNKEL